MSDLKNQQKTNSAVLNAYKTHVDALRRFISRYLRNAQDIEDVTQEAFMRAYKAEQTTDIRQP